MTPELNSTGKIGIGVLSWAQGTSTHTPDRSKISRTPNWWRVGTIIRNGAGKTPTRSAWRFKPNLQTLLTRPDVAVRDRGERNQQTRRPVHRRASCGQSGPAPKADGTHTRRLRPRDHAVERRAMVQHGVSNALRSAEHPYARTGADRARWANWVWCADATAFPCCSAKPSSRGQANGIFSARPTGACSSTTPSTPSTG